MAKELIVFSTLIVMTCSCLITNCPRGGKRGGAVVSLENIPRECPLCGPNQLGQCFGPYICCGSSIGCFFGTSETYGCRKESLFSRPCIAGFAMCRGNTARCAANGICCSQESCYVDRSCRTSAAAGNNRKIDFDLNTIFTENEISNEIVQQR